MSDVSLWEYKRGRVPTESLVSSAPHGELILHQSHGLNLEKVLREKLLFGESECSRVGLRMTEIGDQNENESYFTRAY